ncbi:MAG: adenine phosphoribosyltransferase [Clostridia bacterium]|nr:adenine phosphoribosyltransferase [Clostridia bacterium]
MDLKKHLRVVPDFPKKGIQFFDITTILQNPEAFKYVVDTMADYIGSVPCDVIVSLESRGFLFASAIAYKLGKSHALVRKPGKLPYKTVSESYSLEYGTDTVEMHEDAIAPGQNVVVIDDLLATGGTVDAAIKLVEKLGGKVTALSFFIEIEGLDGREKLAGYEINSILKLRED